MTEQGDPVPQEDTHWRQIAVVFACSAILAITSCGGGILITAGDHSGTVSFFGGLLIVVGCISILVFVLTVLTALIKILFAIIDGFRR